MAKVHVATLKPALCSPTNVMCQKLGKHVQLGTELGTHWLVKVLFYLVA